MIWTAERPDAAPLNGRTGRSKERRGKGPARGGSATPPAAHPMLRNRRSMRKTLSGAAPGRPEQGPETGRRTPGGIDCPPASRTKVRPTPGAQRRGVAAGSGGGAPRLENDDVDQTLDGLE